MKEKIRLVLINMAVTAIIISSLNFLSSAVLFVSGVKMLFVKKSPEEQWYDKRAKLPNYNNRELMKVHFQEYGQTKSSYEAYIAWSRKPFKGKTITIENNGDRVHEEVRGDKSNKSVYFLGGSTIWGEGVPDNGTIPALFSSISGMRSYNKAEGGFNSRQGIARLVNLLAQGEKIDIVIFYDGVNDVAFSCRAELEVSEHYATEIFRKRIKKGEFFREEGEDRGEKKNLKNENVKLFLNGREFLQYLDFALLFGTRSLVAKQKFTARYSVCRR